MKRLFYKAGLANLLFALRAVPCIMGLGLLLFGCSSQPTVPADVDFPLPASEATQIAAYIETGIPAAAFTPALPEAEQAAPATIDSSAQNPPVTASSEAIQPIMPSIDSSQPVTLTGVTEENQTYLNIVVSDGITPTAAALPLPTEVIVEEKAVIIQPEATRREAAGLGALLAPGFLFLLGITLLGTGVWIMNYGSTESQQITSVLNIAELSAGMGWVELQGIVTQVPNPLDQNQQNPLAVMRLVIEVNDPNGGWSVVLDRFKASEFSLEDGTGTVWISPDHLDLSLLGEGSFASIKQAEDALKVLGLQSSSAWGRGLRYKLWELRGGQELIAVGSVQQQLRLSSTANSPLTLTPVEQPPAPNGEAPASTGGSNMLVILLFALALIAILAGSAWFVFILLR